MRFTRRIMSRLAVVLVIAGAIGIGWVSRSLRAQDGAARPKAEPAPEKVAPPELPASEAGLPPVPTSDHPLPPLPTSDASAPVPNAARDPFQLDSAGTANPDPEKAAQVFLDQNRKVASDELKKLRDEEAQLRTRLGKVEAGIRRWEAAARGTRLERQGQGPGVCSADRPRR